MSLVVLILGQDSGWYIHDTGGCLHDPGRYVGEGPRCAISRNQIFQDIGNLLIWFFYNSLDRNLIRNVSTPLPTLNFKTFSLKSFLETTT